MMNTRMSMSQRGGVGRRKKYSASSTAQSVNRFADLQNIQLAGFVSIWTTDFIQLSYKSHYLTLCMTGGLVLVLLKTVLITDFFDSEAYLDQGLYCKAVSVSLFTNYLLDYWEL